MSSAAGRGTGVRAAGASDRRASSVGWRPSNGWEGGAWLGAQGPCGRWSDCELENEHKQRHAHHDKQR